MDIAIPLFDRFTALDAVGPYDVLSRLPGAKVTFVAKGTGPVRNDNASLMVFRSRTDISALDCCLHSTSPSRSERAWASVTGCPGLLR